MGAKDSKPTFISYEDAVKRVSDSDLRRIREAYKKCAGTNGTGLSLEVFVHEVLSDGVPFEVSEWLFQACGGTKRGIAFKDLLCGVVVLTKGNLEEKIKFLWTLYTNNQNDSGTYLYKWDFARTLHMENTSLPISVVPRTSELLNGLFGTGDRVTFDQFRSWLLIHKDATVLSKWLLSEKANIPQDLDTPTFYQSLAGVTHLEERDIIELEKCFWSLRNSASTGQLDLDSMTPLLSPPLPRPAVRGLFQALDENGDGHVDFKELCCGLSAACRGPTTERLKFCFKMFDLDRDGTLDRGELQQMSETLCSVANEALRNASRASTPSGSQDSDQTEKVYDPEVVLLNLRDKLSLTQPRDGRKPVFQLGPSIDGEEINVQKQTDDSTLHPELCLTLEEFLIWSVESSEALVAPLLELVAELGHVVLGLRAACPHKERDIVLGWLRRETGRGYAVGEFWYLVEAGWWAAWLAHTARAADACRHTHADDPALADTSFTTNSTESMGSLLWRAETGSTESSASSGRGSAPAPHRASHPGTIDNAPLLASHTHKPRTLTGEGGLLRRDVTLCEHRDFQLVPDKLWRALAMWYGAPHPLPRQVIRPTNSDLELELYPLQLKLYRHVANAQTGTSVGSHSVGGVSVYSSVPLAPSPPDRQLAYTAAFSRLATVKQVSEFLSQALGIPREDMRLWSLSGGAGGTGGGALLLDDERPTLDALRMQDKPRLLIEVRNQDLTWPEEIGALSMAGSGGRLGARRETLSAPQLAGATGLHNLGNTCFMNAALQAVWNTGPLTRYFNSGTHLYEVNTTNPLGTRGALALRYGELCKEVWGCRAVSVAPLRVRWVVARHALWAAGGGQHDAQELLAWLLDKLHEDLNRAAGRAVQAVPPSIRMPDQVVAAQAWQAHLSHNQSIVTDLFYGQLKSRVRCASCKHESVRFDAFNMLSLPLPIDNTTCVPVKVIRLDGSVPIKYGVKVNTDDTYFTLKENLAELCGLPVDSIMLVELSGARLTSQVEDAWRVATKRCTDLHAYQLPATDVTPLSTRDHIMHAEPVSCSWSSVSAARAPASSSLCMPALFCFKSPPNTFTNHQYHNIGDAVEHGEHGVHWGDYDDGEIHTGPVTNRCNTLPKEMKNYGNSSPTLSLKSFNLKTQNSPKLGRVKFGSSPSNMNNMKEKENIQVGKIKYLVAVHRKQTRSDAYFLPSQRCKPVLFGVPLLVGVREGMSGREIYAQVWAQVARLLTKPPPAADQHNHATDCDDSLGYSFPFLVRAVSAAGARCGVCAWTQHCRGCTLPSTNVPLVTYTHGSTPHMRKRSSVSRASEDIPDTSSPIAKAKLNRQCSGRTNSECELIPENAGELQVLNLNEVRLSTRRGQNPLMLAIDWDPTALHLRYHSNREKECIEHSSLLESRLELSRGVDLASCLSAFTQDEALEQRYHCENCKTSSHATKKLQIWRLPPILIIHLKRFQYVNNKWIKCTKVVNFPVTDFDPTPYLAAIPQETILRHQELLEQNNDQETEESGEAQRPSSAPLRKRLQSTSLVGNAVQDSALQDWHQHHLQPGADALDLKYSLYSVVSHSGQLSGGHYVAYARNPSGAWLCYNDSSCREICPPPAPEQPPPVPRLDPAAAYLLFYERQGLNYDSYLPDVTGKEKLMATDDCDDNDLKKMCVIA